MTKREEVRYWARRALEKVMDLSEEIEVGDDGSDEDVLYELCELTNALERMISVCEDGDLRGMQMDLSELCND